MGNFDTFSRGENPYFDFEDGYQADKDLISVIINEVYNKYGVCMEYYITTYDTTYDRIWGEDNNRCYVRNFNVNAYFNLPREDKIWTKFGIEGTDEIIMWISKRHFQSVSYNNITAESYERPQIGDIIKSDYSTYFYEITEVAEDTGQYLQSNQHVWEVYVRPMKDEFICTTHDLSASDIANVTNLDDIFNIDNDTDVEKENILYDPEAGEKPNTDPFGNW